METSKTELLNFLDFIASVNKTISIETYAPILSFMNNLAISDARDFTAGRQKPGKSGIFIHVIKYPQ